MRTSSKISTLAVAAAMLIGASAATASAHDYQGKHRGGDDINVNVCGNTSQEALAISFLPIVGDSEIEQGTANTVICQAGDANTAVIWAPSFSLIGDIGLLGDVGDIG
ncbi:hypothetical protein PJ985_09865 [Streptomyces sp. ACA25]|uniref:hypothetical protein n=1 Tax=Streptomyces sp. ACA25 TaxID=3022596 RepID=UPI00230769C4|nr:hypothetical protein [Streptomyces sp. ACA25]MDB1087870.1 hypothetical protein [Streptomyces sp. ACA25]